MLRISLILLASLSMGGCVIDRTGQSTTTAWRKELDAHAAQIAAIDHSLDLADARVAQLEEVTRARGQDDIMKMENLDQVRQEMGRLRGDLEVLSHQVGQESSSKESLSKDLDFRMAWLETRAEALEKTLGVKTPQPPVPNPNGAATPPNTAGTTGTTGATTTDPNATMTTVQAEPTVEITDPDAMMKLAEEHLAAGRTAAAEAVLNRFIKENPKNARIAEAKYRLAEARFNAKDYGAAILRFQEVIDNYHDSAWAPYAMLRQGECFEAQGQKANATIFYEDVIRMWPKSKAAKDAKAKLGK